MVFTDDICNFGSFAIFWKSNYFNVANNDHEVEAQICAGLCVAYMENQGLTYHEGRNQQGFYMTLVDHLKIGDGKVLYTADIVDYYLKFAGEF